MLHAQSSNELMQVPFSIVKTWTILRTWKNSHFGRGMRATVKIYVLIARFSRLDNVCIPFQFNYLCTTYLIWCLIGRNRRRLNIAYVRRVQRSYHLTSAFLASHDAYESLRSPAKVSTFQAISRISSAIMTRVISFLKAKVCWPKHANRRMPLKWISPYK